MLSRYQSEENQKTADTIYRLRQLGFTHQEIADKTGKSLQNVVQTCRNELAFRCEAFQFPFIEYLSSRTANAIKKSLGIEALSDPEKLNGVEQVKAVLCWPGVGDKVLKDLVAGLEKAGYEGFDLEEMKDVIYFSKQRLNRQTWKRLGGVDG
jgi:hypothetical protein